MFLLWVPLMHALSAEFLYRLFIYTCIAIFAASLEKRYFFFQRQTRPSRYSQLLKQVDLIWKASTGFVSIVFLLVSRLR